MFFQKQYHGLMKFTAYIALMLSFSWILGAVPRPAFAQSSSRLKLASNNDEAKSGKNERRAWRHMGGRDVRPDDEEELSFSRVRLRMRRRALKKETKIQVEVLNDSDIPVMNKGMKNITAEHRGYRFTPRGQKFDEPVQVVIPYNPEEIPEGLGEENLFTFFYDEEDGNWVRLKRLKVDKENQQVISLTTHFTKMVVGTLTLPESPKAMNFNPNSIKSIKAANPGANITMIEPPKPNSFGGNGLNFPIQVSKGRAGMQPQLAIRYNSSGSNGWLGVGWDLSVPSVGIDTRFGVPDYDNEDTYTLAGDELVKAGSASDGTLYRKRVEGSFQKIVRKGNNAASHYWEVWDKNGQRSRYGYNSDSKLASYRDINAMKPVFKWFVDSQIDSNNNCVKYIYEQDSRPDGSSQEDYRQVYLKRIEYTGRFANNQCSGGLYSVDFITDTSRIDITSSARSRFKVLTRKRLTKIVHKFRDQIIREYHLNYKDDNSSRKSLLTKITAYGAGGSGVSGNDFYSYDFAYHDVTAQNGGYQAFGESTKEYSGAMSMNESFVEENRDLSFTDFLDNFSGNFPLSYSRDHKSNYGIAADIAKTVGVNASWQTGRNSTKFVFADLNGDNLPDLVYKNKDKDVIHVKFNDGNGGFGPVQSFESDNFDFENLFDFIIEQILGLIDSVLKLVRPILKVMKALEDALRRLPFGIGKALADLLVGPIGVVLEGIEAVEALIAALAELPLANIKQNIAVDSSNTYSIGASALGGAASAGISYTKSSGDLMITDFNGDGFIDQLMQKDGKLYYKENINGQKHEIKDLGGSVSSEDLLANDPTVDVVQKNFFFTDAVIGWQAPKSGTIVMSGTVKKLKEGGDGLRAFIFHQSYTSELWSIDIPANDTGRYGHSVELKINKGEKVYFAVNAKNSLVEDAVKWQPEIRYSNSPSSEAYRCDPEISPKTCVLRDGKYELISSRKDRYVFDEDFYVPTGYYKRDALASNSEKEISQQTIGSKTYEMKNPLNPYMGWTIEEWNGTEGKFLNYMTPDPDSFRYTGMGEGVYIASDSMSPARIGGNATQALSSSGELQLSVTNGENFGGGVGATLSYSHSVTKGKLSIMDMNGDRFPDQVTEGSNGSLKVVVNTGGLGFGSTETFKNSLSDNISETVSHGGGLQANLNLSDVDNPPIFLTSPKGKVRAFLPINPSLGGGINFGMSANNRGLMDINGDGLPDHVRWENGKSYLSVKLNLGDGFASTEERWPVSLIKDTWSLPGVLDDIKDQIFPTDGEGLSYTNTVTGSYSLTSGFVGTSENFGVSRTQTSFMDINGDGLPDYLYKDPDKKYFEVRLNQGNGFSTQVIKLNLPDWKTNPNSYFGNMLNGMNAANYGKSFLASSDIINYSGNFSSSLSGNLIVNFAIVNLTFSLSATTSKNSGLVSLRDIDGDGLPDHIFQRYDSGKIQAKINQNARNNLLIGVKGPLGMEMAFDYERKGNTTDHPNSQWVLSKVDVVNGVSVEPGKTKDTYTTTYSYGPGKYDRTERTFYGFSSVKETRADGTVSLTEYHNDSFYNKGLVKKVESYLSDGGFRVSRKLTTYDMKAIVGSGDTARSYFPAAKKQESYIWEQNSGSGLNKYNLVQYEYDNYGNVLSELDAGDEKLNTDDTNLQISYNYNTEKYLVSNPAVVTVYDYSSKTLRKREAGYDANGNLTSFSAHLLDDGGGIATTTFTYDDYGNILSMTDPNNYQINYVYDSEVHSYPVEVSDSFEYSSSAVYDYRFGTLLQSKDLNKNSIHYEYDNFGRQTKIWGPYLEKGDSVPSLQMIYSHKELPAKAVTKNREDYLSGSTNTLDTVLFIDSLRRVIQTKKESSVYSGGSSLHGMTVSGRLLYDNMGRVIEQGQPVFESGPKYTYYSSIPMQNKSRFTYDKQGRRIKVETPLTASSYAVTKTDYSIDEGWLSTTVTDPEGKKKQVFKDINDKIQKMYEYLGSESIVTRYQYNAVGEITEVTDAKGNTTKVSYDSLGRRTSIDNPDAGLTEYKYDLAGNMIEKIDAKLRAREKSIKYVYEYNRLKRVDYPKYEYDTIYYYGDKDATEFNQVGRISKVMDESGHSLYQYGKLGETVRTDRKIYINRIYYGYNGHKGHRGKHKGHYDNHGKNKRGGKGYKNGDDWLEERYSHYNHDKYWEWMVFTTKQRFDSFGRMRELTYPDGEVLTYSYDEGGLLKSATGKKYDKDYSYLKNLVYDEFGQRVHLELGNSITTNYGYDAYTRRLNTLISNSEAGKKIQNLSYTYDRVGNILKIQDDVEDPVTQEFSYDDLYRLKSANGKYTDNKGHPHHHYHYGSHYFRDYPGRHHHPNYHPGPKVYEYERKFSYDNIHNLTQKEAVYRFTSRGGKVHLPPDDNYTMNYTYDGGKPHAVSSITYRYPERKDKEVKTSYYYDHSGNLIQTDKYPHYHHHNHHNQRDLYWHSENRLHQVVDWKQKTTYFVYDANGQRTVKKGEGETIYVNQFYSVRNKVIASKHYFAGNTRLATKISQVRHRYEVGKKDCFPNDNDQGKENNGRNNRGKGQTLQEILGGDIKIVGPGSYLQNPQKRTTVAITGENSSDTSSGTTSTTTDSSSDSSSSSTDTDSSSTTNSGSDSSSSDSYTSDTTNNNDSSDSTGSDSTDSGSDTSGDSSGDTSTDSGDSGNGKGKKGHRDHRNDRGNRDKDRHDNGNHYGNDNNNNDQNNRDNDQNNRDNNNSNNNNDNNNYSNDRNNNRSNSQNNRNDRDDRYDRNSSRHNNSQYNRDRRSGREHDNDKYNKDRRNRNRSGNNLTSDTPISDTPGTDLNLSTSDSSSSNSSSNTTDSGSDTSSDSGDTSSSSSGTTTLGSSSTNDSTGDDSSSDSSSENTQTALTTTGDANTYGFYREGSDDNSYTDNSSNKNSDYDNNSDSNNNKGCSKNGNNGNAYGHSNRKHNDFGRSYHGKNIRLFYYHYDHLGSATLNSDCKGLVYSRTLYFPYGDTWIEEGHDLDKDIVGYKFTAKELDTETGYYYFGARYYDPKVSVWISPDPILASYLPTGEQLFFPEEAFNASSLKGAGGVYNSKNLSLFNYAHENPIRLVDPDGNAPRNAVTGISGGGSSMMNRYRKIMIHQSMPVQSDNRDIYAGAFMGAAGLLISIIGGEVDPKYISKLGKQSQTALEIVTAIGFFASLKSGKSGGKPKLSSYKKALKKVHKELGGPLPRGKKGKFGSPQRGDSKKGYRLDPPHTSHPKDSPGSKTHINYWDYTKGKRGKGAIEGTIPIE